MDRKKPEIPNFLECEDCISFNLRRATRSVTQFFDDVLKPSGLLSTQFTLMAAVTAMGSGTINRLADRLGMDRTTMSRNLRPLERLGLIEILAGKDRRTRVVIATDKGRETLLKAHPLWEKAQRQMQQGLGPEGSLRLLSDLSTAIAATAAETVVH